MKSKSIFSVVVSSALALTVLTSLSGCTQDEIAATALIIGAAAIASGGGDVQGPRHEDHGGFGRDHGPGGFDHGPGDHRPGGFDHGPGGFDHGPGDRGPGGNHSHNFDAQISFSNEFDQSARPSLNAEMKAFVSTDKRVVSMAAKYNITDYAATYLVRAIVLAQAKDTSGIKDLGLKVEDFKDMFDGKALESEKVDTLASKLKMDSSATNQLVSKMTSDVQVEKAARGL